MEMDNELDKRVKDDYQIASPAKQPGATKRAVTFNDLDDDDDDDDEEDLAIGPKLSNEELFYDPHMDDDDQKWVDSQRLQHGSHSGSKQKAAPNSDAVLDCPACLTTLCIDCQRHSVYQNQYRAMFVINCAVDRTRVLTYREESRKRGKKGRSACAGTKQQRADDGGGEKRDVIGDANGPSRERNANATEVINDCEVKVDRSSASSEAVSAPVGGRTAGSEDVSVAVGGRIAGSEAVSAAVGGRTAGSEAVSVAVGGRTDTVISNVDQFYSVYCAECETGVGAMDGDEVYHFYNVIAAYT